MTAPILRLTLVCGLVFAAAVGAIRARPMTESSLTFDELLTPCPTPDLAPCIFGLQPGVSTVEDVRRFLLRHPAVRDHFPNVEGLPDATGSIYVDWRSDALAGALPSYSGELTLDGGTLTMIQVSLDTPLYTVGLALPNADRLLAQRFNATLYGISLTYYDRALVVSALGQCPPRLEALWNAPMLTLTRRESRPGSALPQPRASRARVCVP
jgi:hypothetical protein